MDNQQDSEAIERRRTQNRIAQRKHRQRRAQLLRDYQNHDRRSKEGRIEDYDQEPQQESGEDANQPFSGSKVPQVPFDSQASKECINCQCERNARTANELSQEAESTSNSSQPLNTLDPASSFENNVTVSSVQNESRANESPSVVRVNGVVLPSPKGYISPSFHNNDNQYYLDATASLEDDDDFLGSILGSTDYIETTDTDTRRVGNQIQSIDSVVVSLEDVSNPKTRPRSASHCYSVRPFQIGGTQLGLNTLQLGN
ncbi:hypothetical protein PVAG01_05845 [Phlyctema vagabunda]|uniref:BZIP domain-containing protein n=1 Tax=Phlyctema vagabunda TaxID=108571 RepID=A0ABR4PED0_9HELO